MPAPMAENDANTTAGKDLNHRGAQGRTEEKNGTTSVRLRAPLWLMLFAGTSGGDEPRKKQQSHGGRSEHDHEHHSERPGAEYIE